MRHRMRWLLPGMGVKRWISLAVLGLLILSGGVSFVTYYFARELQGRPTHPEFVPVGVALILLGALVGASASRRLIREVVRVLRPQDTNLLDAFYRQRSRRGPKVVAIGGGTGLATLLRGLKHYSDNITAIVATADNGGSSGRLREELGILPPGDLRHCLTALAGEEELLTRLFDYRFRGGTALDGHSFGNLFLTALADIGGDFEAAVRGASKVLAIRGQVLPATLVPLELVATLEDGLVVRGESQISRSAQPIVSVACEPADPPALPEALRAIEEADVILIGPGSLYTSLAPNLLVPELRAALVRSRAPRLYVCNVMTQPGETDHYTVADHVRALQRLGGGDIIQLVLVNSVLPDRQREKYQAQGQFPVPCDTEACEALGVKVLEAPLLGEGDLVRHDPGALARAVVDWLLTGKRDARTRLLAFPAEAELSAKTRGWL